MKYRSFNHQEVNTVQTKRRRNRNNNRNKSAKRSIALIASIVVILFGLKLLLTPIVGSLAAMVKQSTISLSSLISRQGLKNTDGITNILLLGIDERYDGGPALTDTIIILSYRSDDQKLSMISLPRDLWVSVPKFDGVASYYTKINSVYSVGESNGYTRLNDEEWGGGAGLLGQLIENHTGLPLHYYAKINFNGFKEAIDAVGGLDIYVENAFTDYQYPRDGYENAPWDSRWEILSFDQGWQHMDGTTALKYARSRHAYGGEGSDFARARRQQKVLLALKEKIFSNKTLFDINKVRNLYITFSSQFDTNISVGEVPVIYSLIQKQGDLQNINSIVLNNSGTDEGGLLYEPDPVDFGGAYILLPRNGWSSIEEYLYKQLRGN